MTYPTSAPAPSIVESEVVNPDLAEALHEVELHDEEYAAAREYDEINLWNKLLATPEGDILRQADIEYDPNFCSVVIDAVNNRLEIVSVTATLTDDPDDGESDNTDNAPTQVLNEVWEKNELGNYFPVWHRRALRDGDAYLVVWPSEFTTSGDMEGEALDPTAEMIEVADVERPTAVNITYVDPRLGRMLYDPENPRVKRAFVQRWTIPDPDGRSDARVRLNLLYPDRVEKYISKASSKGNKPGDFEPYVDPLDMVEYEAQVAAWEESGSTGEEPVYPWPMPNPYNQIPVFHLRTDLEYGKPEHRNAFALQDAMSKLIETLMVTARFQGWPQTYLLQEADNFKSQSLQENPLAEGEPGMDLGGTSAGGLSLDHLPADLDDTDTGSRFMASPGTIMMLKNVKEISQLKTADPNVFLEPWREFGKAISATTDTPLYKFHGLGGQAPSGESLKIIDAPLNKKAINRSRLFGTAEQRMFEFILELLGFPNARVTIAWANPATTDLIEVWELVEKKISLGVPRYIAFMQAGVPETQAREWADAYEAAAAVRVPVQPTSGNED